MICAILLCADVDQSEKSPDDEAFFGKKHFGQVEFPQKGQWVSKFGAFRCRSHDCVVASALKFGVVVFDVCSNLCTKFLYHAKFRCALNLASSNYSFANCT